ncbi:unnamed protein product [Sphagnum troendelagicum]|uniref:Uncharacterized protein n=1 Tax=Sphagnum troendelagicum TaxID=128251 RepID=A0ABP0TXT5_9BRYO
MATSILDSHVSIGELSVLRPMISQCPSRATVHLGSVFLQRENVWRYNERAQQRKLRRCSEDSGDRDDGGLTLGDPTALAAASFDVAARTVVMAGPTSFSTLTSQCTGKRPLSRKKPVRQ